MDQRQRGHGQCWEGTEGEVVTHGIQKNGGVKVAVSRQVKGVFQRLSGTRHQHFDPSQASQNFWG